MLKTCEIKFFVEKQNTALPSTNTVKLSIPCSKVLVIFSRVLEVWRWVSDAVWLVQNWLLHCDLFWRWCFCVHSCCWCFSIWSVQQWFVSVLELLLMQVLFWCRSSSFPHWHHLGYLGSLSVSVVLVLIIIVSPLAPSALSWFTWC